MTKHPLILAALGCAAVACLLQIVGVATPYWSSIDLGPISANTGLWKMCQPVSLTDKECTDWPEIPDWLKAVRAFGILAILVMAGAAMVGVLVVVIETMSSMIVVAAALDFVGTLCSVIGFAIYAAKNATPEGTPSPTYGYSFILCIVGAVLAGVSGGCFFAGKFKLNVQ